MSFFKKLFGKNKEQQVTEEIHLDHEENVLEEPEASKTAETQEETMTVEEEKETAAEAEEEAVQEDEVCEEAEVSSQSHLSDEEQHEEQCEETETVQEAVEEKEEETLSAETAVVKEVSHEETSVHEEEVLEEEQSNGVAEEIQEEPEAETAEENKKGFIKRLFSGLTKTRDSILKGVDDVLSNFKHIDDDLYEELEEALIMADFGVETTLHMMEQLKAKVKSEKITDPSDLKPALKEIITGILTDHETADILNPNGPTVVLVIGVNGVGKTTSIGKMSHLFKSQGKKVLVAAADTFRAAAIEQLNIWTDRAGVDIIKHDEGSDAAAVVFDAISAAKSRKSDVLICDTAGRLQNKTNLMKELEKISRIIEREYPEAKKEILIVIDATTGQNAMQQVKLFKEVADISGIILTKLDGTAKGGAIVGIYETLKVPVKYIGVGEKIDDLQPFDANAFAKALFEAEA